MFQRIGAKDASVWNEFEKRYRDMMIGFCRRRGMQLFDAEDVVQRVMTDLVRSLPQFVYDPKRGRFRDYLYRCVRNAINYWAKTTDRQPDQLRSGAVAFIEADCGNGSSIEGEAQWEKEWMAHHYRLAINHIRLTFEPQSVEIFNRSIHGASLGELASDLVMTEEAVRKVRERIRNRMEEQIRRQIEEEDGIEIP